MKIMIVDDHPGMRKILTQLVRLAFSEPVDVIECASGEEAVLTYSEQYPDCVLMDYQLLTMDGFEATRIIHDQDASAKIIMVTSYDNPSFRAKALDLDLLGFVSKENLSDITPLLQSFTSTQ